MKRGLVIVVLMALFVQSIIALPNSSISTSVATDTINGNSSNRLKVGLVLSGGGAKGTAHIGVLKILEKAGIPIDYIAGTSMGAIVGGLYSIGFSADDLDQLFKTQQWTKLLTSTLDRGLLSYEEKELSDKTIISIPFSSHLPEISNGVLSGEGIMNMLTLYTTGYHNMQSFDNLPIPFACVAYDINSGNEVVLRSGNLATAIRASMSIPGVFEMVMDGDRLFVDGGVINNFPVDVVRDMGADVVIGVDVSMVTEVRTNDAEGYFEPTFGSLSFVTQTLIERMGKEKFLKNFDNVDLYIAPRIHPYSTASFSNQAIDSLINRGFTAANDNLQAIMEFKKMVYGANSIAEVQNITEPVQFQKSKTSQSDSIQLREIQILGLKSISEHRVANILKIEEYSKITHQDIIDGISNIKGTGLFSIVSYSLINKAENNSYDLIINCVESGKNKVHLGVRFDSEKLAALYLYSTISSKKLKGGVAEVKGRLSIDPYINLGVYFRDPFLGHTGISYEYQRSTAKLISAEDDYLASEAEFGHHTLSFHLFELYLNNFNFDMKLKYKRFVPYRSAFFQYDPTFQNQYAENLLVYSGTLHYDSYDDAYFPTRGAKFRLNYDLTTDNFVSYNDKKAIGSADVLIEGIIPISKHFFVTPTLYGRFIDMTSSPFSLRNFLGGHINNYYIENQRVFYGQRTLSITESFIGVAYLDLRYRIGENHHIWTKANAAYGSNKVYDFYAPSTTYIGGATGYSYTSILGPISIMVDYMIAPYRNVGLFISLGKTF